MKPRLSTWWSSHGVECMSSDQIQLPNEVVWSPDPTSWMYAFCLIFPSSEKMQLSFFRVKSIEHELWYKLKVAIGQKFWKTSEINKNLQKNESIFVPSEKIELSFFRVRSIEYEMWYELKVAIGQKFWKTYKINKN